MYRRLSLTDGSTLSAATALVLTAALLVLYKVNPIGSSLYPSCPIYAASGLYCPGCGSLRALHQLTHGHLLAALSLNPLMVISLPFVTYGLASGTMRAVRGRALPGVFLSRFWIMAIFWLVIVYTVLRNIPAYPFNLLAP